MHAFSAVCLVVNKKVPGITPKVDVDPMTLTTADGTQIQELGDMLDERAHIRGDTPCQG